MIKKILILSLLVRFFLFVLFLINSPDILVFDAEGYHKLAIQYLGEGNAGLSDAIRTPGYPFFIGLIYLITPHPYLVVFIQIFINTGSVYLIYLIGKEIFNEETGLIASLIFAFEPDHLFFTYSLLSETLFILVMLSCILLLFRYIRSGKHLVPLSLLMGIGILIKPVVLYLPLVLSLTLKRRFVFLIIVYSIAGTWCFRNKIKYDHFQLTTITGHNLLNYNAALTKAKVENMPYQQARNELRIKGSENPFEYSELQKRAALNYLRNHKAEYLKTHLGGSAKIFLSMNYKHFMNRFFNTKIPDDSYGEFSFNIKRIDSLPLLLGGTYYLVFLLCYPLSLAGIVLSLKNKRIMILLLIMAYFIFIIGPVGNARYKLPISSIYILFASWTLISIKKLVKFKENPLRT